MEIQVYEDYVGVLKSKVTMKTRAWKVPFSFVDVDPLDESLLRYSDAMDKAPEAAKKYSSRLGLGLGLLS